MPDVDIVIPVYNEDREIVATLTALERCVTVPFCVLICYDHEDDRTLPVVEAYRQRTGLQVRFIKNTGAGAHGGCSDCAKRNERTCHEAQNDQRWQVERCSCDPCRLGAHCNGGRHDRIERHELNIRLGRRLRIVHQVPFAVRSNAN